MKLVACWFFLCETSKLIFLLVNRFCSLKLLLIIFVLGTFCMLNFSRETCCMLIFPIAKLLHRFFTCKIEFVHGTCCFLIFVRLNMFHVYFSLRKTCTLIFHLLKLIFSWSFLRAGSFTWNLLHVDFSRRETYFHHGTCLELIFVRVTCCMLIFLFVKLVHRLFFLWNWICSWKMFRSEFFCGKSCVVIFVCEACCVFILLFVKLLLWFFSFWNCVCLWNMLHIDFRFWNLFPADNCTCKLLHFVVFPHETVFVLGTCCVLIFVLGTGCVLTFVHGRCCMFIFLFVKLVLWVFSSWNWFCSWKFCGLFLYVKLFVCWFFS